MPPARRQRRPDPGGFASHAEYLEAVWRGRLSDLRAFKRRFGHTRVPQKWQEDLPLERWVRRQRELHRLNELRQDRRAQLARIGFEFELDVPPRVAWEQRLRELAAFRRRSGHCRVPERWSENPALAHWVRAQRALEAQGTLRPERRRKLDALGFTWRRNRILPWESMCSRLRAFRRAHGHADVSSHSGDARLLHWVQRQRMLFHTGRLAPERRRTLERLGFRFRIQGRRRSFDEAVAELRALRRRGARPREVDPSLTVWIANLRRKQDQLTAAQRTTLEKLGVRFDVRDARWQAMLERLLAFRTRHGHVHVPASFRADRTLARWVVKQRVAHRQRTLRRPRLRTLEALGLFDRTDRWQEQYRTLERFVAAHGHARVMPSDDAELAQWVGVQRRLARQGALAPRRRRLLEKLSFCWSPHDAAWQRQLDALRAFRARHGHCDVPHLSATHRALGSWVASQRRAYRAKRLSRERVRALARMGFTWNPLRHGRRARQ